MCDRFDEPDSNQSKCSTKSKSGDEVTDIVSKEVIRKKAGCRKSLEEIENNVKKAREESLSNPAFEKVHVSINY